MTVSSQLILNAIIILALLVWVGYRQTTWRAVDPSRMWRMPIILAVIGVISLGGVNLLGGTKSPTTFTITGVDVAFLVLELAVSLGLGALMGAISTFRPMTREASERYAQARANDRHPSTSTATLEARTGWFGLVLWLVLIAVRVGMDLLAAHAGATMLSSTGIILLTVAANRIARVAVILYRAGRVPAAVGA